MKSLIIADSKDNLHDPNTLQSLEYNNGKNLFGFSRRSSNAENSFLSESQSKIADVKSHSLYNDPPEKKLSE